MWKTARHCVPSSVLSQKDAEDAEDGQKGLEGPMQKKTKVNPSHEENNNTRDTEEVCHDCAIEHPPQASHRIRYPASYPSLQSFVSKQVVQVAPSVLIEGASGPMKWVNGRYEV